MLYGASNGHMSNDVTWPQKVKVVTPIYLEPNISKTLGDRDLVSMEHQQETPYWESNRHVIEWRYVTLKGQGRDPNMFRAQYLEKAGDSEESVTIKRQ